MLRKLVLLLFVGLISVAAFAQQRYAQHASAINVGILVIDSQVAGGIPDDTPHAWYDLDKNIRVKPANWLLDNPAHPGRVLGQQVRREDGAYWEVFLSQLSESQLAEYDMLLLPAHGGVALNTSEREKLRRFLDKGGILWVDINATSGMDLVNNLPAPYQLSGTTTFGLNPYWAHPLLSYPNQITGQDLVAMPFANSVGVRPVTSADIGSLMGIETSIPGESARLQRITGDAANMNIAVAKVGGGYEVITTHGVASTLNSAFVAGNAPTFNVATDAASRLVVNMLSLAGSYNEEGRGPRKANSGPINIDAPLLNDFQIPGSFGPTGAKGYSPPVLYKGLLVVSTGTQILVYDADPKQDLDGDGNPDDGIPDYTSTGTSYDLVWQSEVFGSNISSPTCIEVPNAPAGNRDQIWVVNSSGSLIGFNAFHFTGALTAVPHDWQIDPPADAGGAASFTGADGPGPYPPTFNQGMLFVADAVSGGPTAEGRVWVANPSASPTPTNLKSQAGGAAAWFAGGLGSSVLPESSGPATIGEIPILDNSGGSDVVVYLPTRPNGSGGGTPGSTAGVSSLWFGAKGEVPQSVNVSGGTLVVATRAVRNGLSVFLPDPSIETDPAVMSLGPKLTILDQAGNPLSQAQMANIFTGQTPTQAFGVLSFAMSNPGALPTGFGVRLDYTIDWGTGSSSATAQILRGQFFLPDDASHNRRILNGVALSPQGTMHMVLSTQDTSTPDLAGGSYYAIREEGRGSFRVLTRWDLYDAFTVTINNSQDLPYPATLTNRDPVTQLFPFLAGSLNHLTFISSPVISNGVAYVTAEGMLSSGFGQIPNTILLAFKAEPDVVELKTGSLGSDFTITQPNILQSTNKTNPDAQANQLLPNQYVYEQQPGSDQGVLRIESLSSTRNGDLQNVFNLSEPVILQKTGSPDSLFEPDRNGSRWSPLLWYTVFTGMGNNQNTQTGQTGPVFISGDTLFMPSTSYLPSFISGPPLRAQGVLCAMTTSITTNDPFLSPDPARPWLSQLFQMSAPIGSSISLNNILPNPDILWPQTQGVSSFDDYRIRVLQSTLGNSSIAYGLIGGNGKIFAWSDNGFWSYSRAAFSVADENRIVELDAVGNPIWSTDQTLTTGPVGAGSVGTVKPLVHPVRAYPLGQNSTLAVDPGSNRLAILDRDGRESRSIEGFVRDPGGFVPEGYRSNEPTSFSRPEDAAVYTSIVTTGNPLQNPQAAEYWQHYLVADTGNMRLVDIVDRYQYDPASGQIGSRIALGILFWHSPEVIAGKKYSYTSVARIFTGGAGGTWKIAAGVTNVEPTGAGAGLQPDTTSSPQEGATGNGGIIVFDNATTQVINTVQMPQIAANALFDPTPGNELGGTFDQPQVNGRSKLLHALNSVSMSNVNGQLAIMFTDDSGVYEIQDSGGGNWAVDWMLPRSIGVSLGVTAPVYSVMRRTTSDVPTVNDPLDFRATYAKRLTSGDVLVVNGYVGRYRKLTTDPLVDFRGEVLGIDGGSPTAPSITGHGFDPTVKNLGFSGLSIKFEIPPVNGTRGLSAPTFADRR